MEESEFTVAIEGIEVRGHIGQSSDARAAGQLLSVDVQMTPCGRDALVLDELASTVDWRRATTIVQEVVDGEECRLIERLAAILCNRLWASLSLKSVTVTIRGSASLLDASTGTVAARVARRE